MITSIQEQIKILAELQKIDSEIYRLRTDLAQQPVLQKKCEELFEKKKGSLKFAEDELKTLQLKQRDKESELGIKEEKIKKLQSQLYQLKSNKEYSAMEMEIKGLKADQSLLEEEILRMLDAVDQAKSKYAAEKNQLSCEEKKFKEELDGIQKITERINAEVASFEEKRKAYTPNLEPKLIAQYEKILKSREGLALVPVRKNSCGGCNLELPPQVVNQVMMQETLVVCESCSRILYWAP